LSPMHAHELQHVPFEDLGSIGPWLIQAGYKISHTRFFESTVLPDADDVDLLVVMGGPMSANDEAMLPWLVEEKRFIRSAILAGKPVLGVCLGAQLIASAMGARVYPNNEKEIGWFPVELEPSSDGSAFRFPPLLEVFHWHGETFDLPPGAIRLARSEACENQAFQLGQNVIGIQFHLEMTPRGALALIENCRSDLLSQRFVQTEEALRAIPDSRYHATNTMMGEVLAYLVRAGKM
jgi:GMP synthase-like glutamine amidotransferase